MKTLEKISLKDWDLLSENESAKLYGGNQPPVRSDTTSVPMDSTTTKKTPTSLTISGSSNYDASKKIGSTSVGVSVSKSGSWSAGVTGSYSYGSGTPGGFSFGISGSKTFKLP